MNSGSWNAEWNWRKENLNENFALLATEILTPCSPSPCGSNAICRELNGVGACTCAPEYVGNPYEGCRPECVLSSDCPSHLDCIRSKCQDPCPGTCGQNADCQVINHLPTCTCLSMYTGDPFRHCSPVPLGNASTREFYVLEGLL